MEGSVCPKFSDQREHNSGAPRIKDGFMSRTKSEEIQVYIFQLIFKVMIILDSFLK